MTPPPFCEPSDFGVHTIELVAAAQTIRLWRDHWTLESHGRLKSYKNTHQRVTYIFIYQIKTLKQNQGHCIWELQMESVTRIKHNCDPPKL